MTTTTGIPSSFSADQMQKIVYELLTKLSLEPSTSQVEKLAETNARILLNHLITILEKRIDNLTPEIDDDLFEDEWVVMVWAILNVLSRMPKDSENDSKQNLNHLLVGLVNRAKPIRIPILMKEAEASWPQFHQHFNQTLHLMHDLYSRLDNPASNIDSHLEHFRERQLQPCLAAFREMCVLQANSMHTELRKKQVEKRREMEKLIEEDYQLLVRYNTNCLYILGLLAARLQGFLYECSSQFGFCFPMIKNMLDMVLMSYESLLNDSLVSIEPSCSSILVTNNLFTYSCASLSKSLYFKNFDVQIVSEDTAITIQDQIRKIRSGQIMTAQPLAFSSAALLAMKPTSGVKRNNSIANATGEGGNTAHKKSDVNSKESVKIQPTYGEKQHAWHAQYPHLLCTTRQKDTVLLDVRSGTIGKRPLFYFYTRAKTFSPMGRMFYVRTLSLPFTIATRRNQDCQVQRMMSSYTATCFWLYGSCTIDGLLLNWSDEPIVWHRFKELACQYITVNSDIKRPLLESDFNLLAEKMQCDDCCDDYQQLKGQKLISFKNTLCPHLRFETETMTMRFSVWRGILEVLQIFQETKSYVKSLWDDYLIFGFLDTREAINLLLPHRSCIVARLTYILGGSICVSYRQMSGEVVHLEPIELKKLQAKSIMEYLADIAESTKIDYILSARNEIVPVSEIINKYKVGEEVKRVRMVTSNVSHEGPLQMMQNVKFTPLRVAVVACRDAHSTMCAPPQPPLPPTDQLFATHHNPHHVPVLGHNNQVPVIPQVSFEVQLESLMKMYGKTPNEVCDIFTPYAPISQNQPGVYNPYNDPQANYEYC